MKKNEKEKGKINIQLEIDNRKYKCLGHILRKPEHIDLIIIDRQCSGITAKNNNTQEETGGGHAKHGEGISEITWNNMHNYKD